MRALVPARWPRAGLGRAAKVALLLAVILVTVPAAGYFYIMEYVRSLTEQVHVEIMEMNIFVWEKKIAINATVAVNNPSDFDVDITSVSFDVLYEGEPVGTGKALRSFRLRPHSYENIWLLILPKPGETFYRMLEGLTKGGVWVTIEGTIHAQAYVFGLFTYPIDQSFSLRRKIEMELPLDIENLGDYIQIRSMRVLRPGTVIEVCLEIRNPLADAYEPLPFNITNLSIEVFVNETYFGTGALAEPVQVPPAGSTEARLLIETTEEAVRNLVEASLSGMSLVMESVGEVTVRIYDIEITRPIEYDQTFSVGMGPSIESLFDFRVRNMSDLGVRDGWHEFEVWFDLRLHAPKTPLDVEFKYNITYFRLEIYDERDRYIGEAELLEPIQAELANTTKLAHARLRIKESVFHKAVRGESREIAIAWRPRNLKVCIQVYSIEIEMEREELNLPPLVSLQVVIGGVKMVSPSALQHPPVVTEAYMTITNPMDFDIYLLSLNGQPAIGFDMYCLEHGRYLGYGYLMENVTIRAQSTKGIAITLVIVEQGADHLMAAHRCGLLICVTPWLKNGYIVLGILGLVFTITFEVVMK